MAIKFPSIHIANSVVNRILNVADGINAAEVRASAPAVVPDTARMGADLNAALAAPTPPLPPIDQAPDTGGTLAGRPLISTLLEPGT